MKILSILFFFVASIQAHSQSFEANKKCISDEWKNVSSFKTTVIRNADGDTIKIKLNSGEMSVRMLGIDTAETNYQGKSQGYWGELAKKRLQTLLPPGAKIAIELDVEKCDFYQRMLGYVYLVSGTKLIPIHNILLSEGLAVNYCIAPNLKRCEEYGKTVALAIKQKKGVFSDPKFEVPYEWRKRVSNRPNDRFPGDIFSKVVFKDKDAVSKIPLERRVFFSRVADVPKGYRWIQ